MTGGLNINTTGSVNAFAVLNAGISSGLGQAGLRLFAGSGTTNRASRIDFFNNVASTTVPRWVIINDTSQNGTNDLQIQNNASTSTLTILQSGNVGIGTNNPNCKFQVYNGVANINNGSPYAVANNYMAAGSLTIGGTTTNYGGGSSQWTTNTAGLLMECQDNTEIAIHDAGNRVASFMYYVGGTTNQFFIGRDMGWGGITQTTFTGNLNVGGHTTIYASGDISSSGNLSIGSVLTLPNGIWHNSADGINRFWFDTNGRTYFHQGGNTGYTFRNTAQGDIVTIDNAGNLNSAASVSASGNITAGSKLYASRHICNATTISYISNWNGTSYSGWFISFNDFLYAGTTSYVTLCFNQTTTTTNQWFGRLFFNWTSGYSGYLVTYHQG